MTHFRLSEIEHKYGANVHILDDPFLSTLLAKLCHPDVGQPVFNDLIRVLYSSLIRTVINCQFPRSNQKMPTRMQAVSEHGVLEGSFIERETNTVVVDIARAGILPSQVCYDTLNGVLEPRAVRQDHLIMARTVDQANQVTGAEISGAKIGGTIEDCIVLFPDPMGATGNSLATAMESYLKGGFGSPRQMIALNLIITPEYIRCLSDRLPDVKIFALRLDRGLSEPKALAAAPGEFWSLEKGLNENQYIIPGGGGFGELMNNSWI